MISPPTGPPADKLSMAPIMYAPCTRMRAADDSAEIHKPPASIRFAPTTHALAATVEPFKFSPAEPVAYELSYLLPSKSFRIIPDEPAAHASSSFFIGGKICLTSIMA